MGTKLEVVAVVMVMIVIVPAVDDVEVPSLLRRTVITVSGTRLSKKKKTNTYSTTELGAERCNNSPSSFLIHYALRQRQRMLTLYVEEVGASVRKRELEERVVGLDGRQVTLAPNLLPANQLYPVSFTWRSDVYVP